MEALSIAEAMELVRINEEAMVVQFQTWLKATPGSSLNWLRARFTFPHPFLLLSCSLCCSFAAWAQQFTLFI